MSNETMSADDVLSVLDNEIRALPVMAGLIRHGEHQCDETPAVKKLQKAREAVAALIAERDARRDDAERYRFIREMDNFRFMSGGRSGFMLGNFGEELDDITDAARSEESNADQS